jgi:hypothetical protein
MTEGLSSAERARANDRQRRQYAKEASTYDERSDSSERWLFGTRHRGWACSRAKGDTLEVAIGTGLNLPSYPPGCAPDRHRPHPRDAGARACPRRGHRHAGHALRRRRAGAPVPRRHVRHRALHVLDVQRARRRSNGSRDEACAQAWRTAHPGRPRTQQYRSDWIQRLMELAPSRGERELTRRPITHVPLAS